MSRQTARQREALRDYRPATGPDAQDSLLQRQGINLWRVSAGVAMGGVLVGLFGALLEGLRRLFQ